MAATLALPQPGSRPAHRGRGAPAEREHDGYERDDSHGGRGDAQRRGRRGAQVSCLGVAADNPSVEVSDKPHVGVQIGAELFVALVDSGAQVSVVASCDLGLMHGGPGCVGQVQVGVTVNDHGDHHDGHHRSRTNDARRDPDGACGRPTCSILVPRRPARVESVQRRERRLAAAACWVRAWEADIAAWLRRMHRFGAHCRVCGQLSEYFIKGNFSHWHRLPAYSTPLTLGATAALV